MADHLAVQPAGGLRGAEEELGSGEEPDQIGSARHSTDLSEQVQPKRSQAPLARPMEWQVPWAARGKPGARTWQKLSPRVQREGSSARKLSREMARSEHQQVPASSQSPEVWPSATQPTEQAQSPKVHLHCRCLMHASGMET
jgi:hypothetical protein